MRIVPILAFLPIALLVLSTGTALTCSQDSDCDNADTCSQPDHCVSGVCQLGGGGDTNDDLVCDAELDPDVMIEMNKVVVRRKTSLSDDNSSVKGRGGILLSGSAVGAFVGDDGLAIRVRDSLVGIPPAGDGVDASFTWLASECRTKPVGSIRCKSGDGRGSFKFKPNPLAPEQAKFSFRVKSGLDLAGPFFGPVRVVLSRGARHSEDGMTDCRLALDGLQCREF